MRQYDSGNLIVRPGGTSDPDVITEVTPELAGWEYLNFQVRRLAEHGSWTFATGEHEMALVPLSGRIHVESNRGQWSQIGGRESVFSGLPHALYLPRRTSFTVQAETPCEYAAVWV